MEPIIPFNRIGVESLPFFHLDFSDLRPIIAYSTHPEVSTYLRKYRDSSVREHRSYAPRIPAFRVLQWSKAWQAKPRG